MKLKDTKTQGQDTVYIVEYEKTVSETKEYKASELENELTRLKKRKNDLTQQLSEIEREIANIEGIKKVIN